MNPFSLVVNSPTRTDTQKGGVFMFPGIRWTRMKWEKVNEHIARKMVKKDHIMMVMWRFDPHQVWPVEIHEAKQGGYVFKGKAGLILPTARKKIVPRSGDGYAIEPNLPHAWKTLDEETILMDIFSPSQEELLPNKFAPREVKWREWRV